MCVEGSDWFSRRTKECDCCTSIGIVEEGKIYSHAHGLVDMIISDEGSQRLL